MRNGLKNWLALAALSCAMACILFLPQIRADIAEREAVQASEFTCDGVEIDGMSAEETEYYTAPPYPYEPWEEEKTEAAILSKAHRLSDVMCTFYCIDSCGKKPSDPTYGITATGVQAQPYHTVAVDPSVIPLGASVAVDYGDGNLQYYTAEDTGGAIKGKHIDVCLENCAYCYDMGVKTVTVWWWCE